MPVSYTHLGRGIPVDIQADTGLPAVTVVYTILHAGGKFGGENSGYKVAGGCTTFTRSSFRRGGAARRWTASKDTPCPPRRRLPEQDVYKRQVRASTITLSFSPRRMTRTPEP